MVYALLVDEDNGLTNREERREYLDVELSVPLDPEAEVEYRREHWGQGQEARQAEAAIEKAGVPSYGDDLDDGETAWPS